MGRCWLCVCLWLWAGDSLWWSRGPQAEKESEKKILESKIELLRSELARTNGQVETMQNSKGTIEVGSLWGVSLDGWMGGATHIDGMLLLQRECASIRQQMELTLSEKAAQIEQLQQKLAKQQDEGNEAAAIVKKLQDEKVALIQELQDSQKGLQEKLSAMSKRMDAMHKESQDEKVNLNRDMARVRALRDELQVKLAECEATLKMKLGELASCEKKCQALMQERQADMTSLEDKEKVRTSWHAPMSKRERES